MKRPAVLVIGTGSVGCRHIENLLSLNVEVSAFRYRIDLKDELIKKYGIKLFDSLDEAIAAKHDAVVVANRPDQHISAALLGAQRGMHLFIEKPLSHTLEGVQELKEIIDSKRLIVEIGCMMRFHPNIIKIRQILSDGLIGTPYLATSCVGQFLPEWRPNQDYRYSYSAKSGYGGGVLFDLIHELDYLYWCFGPVSDVSAFLDHISDLEIETEDIAQILLRFKNGFVAQVELDYLSPFYRRTCELVGSNGIIRWDYNSGEVILKTRGKSKTKIFTQPAAFDRNVMFVDHMKHFLNIIQDGGKPAISLSDGIEVLRIALAAHKSSKDRRVVRLSEIIGEV